MVFGVNLLNVLLLDQNIKYIPITINKDCGAKKPAKLVTLKYESEIFFIIVVYFYALLVVCGSSIRLSHAIYNDIKH